MIHSQSARWDETTVARPLLLFFALAALAPAALGPLSEVALAAEPELRVVSVTNDEPHRQNWSFAKGLGAYEDLELAVKHSDAGIASAAWSLSADGVVSLSEASGTGARVGALSREGWAVLTAAATLDDGTSLSAEVVYAVYTPVPSVAGYASEEAELVRGPDPGSASKWVRGVARPGDALTVVGRCGSRYRVRMHEGFVFDDGSEPGKLVYIDSDKVSVPVTGIVLDAEGPLALYVGDSADLRATVEPDIATGAAVSWSSSDPSVASVSGGRVVARAAGRATVAASCGGESAELEVSVSPLVERTEPHVKSRGREWVRLAWEPCTRATAYSVQLYSKGAWREAGATSKATYKVTGLKAGKKYSLRVVPRGAEGVIGKASSPKNKCRARTRAPKAAAVGKSPAKKKSKKKSKKKAAKRSTAVSKTQRYVMDNATYSFPNWSGKVTWIKKDFKKLTKLLSEDGNWLGKDRVSLKGSKERGASGSIVFQVFSRQSD